ncbi:unnamed protein product [Pleuronectes platessa]|uniref:Uncharacterized protein n=1 Tax=Pleuronectes platessa TaxID=8262 RepID=A0A9N7VBJ7_PLEPL|nr:unnamed protein product [Pleuronectes platessa]
MSVLRSDLNLTDCGATLNRSTPSCRFQTLFSALIKEHKLFVLPNDFMSFRQIRSISSLLFSSIPPSFSFPLQSVHQFCREAEQHTSASSRRFEFHCYSSVGVDQQDGGAGRYNLMKNSPQRDPGPSVSPLLRYMEVQRDPVAGCIM